MKTVNHLAIIDKGKAKILLIVWFRFDFIFDSIYNLNEKQSLRFITTLDLMFEVGFEKQEIKKYDAKNSF